jgi:hypothetical protein
MDDLQQSVIHICLSTWMQSLLKKQSYEKERKKIYEDGFDTLMITEILTECRWQNAIFLERDPNPFPDDN